MLDFPRSKEAGGDAHAIATTSILLQTDIGSENVLGPCVRIQGPKGEIQVFPPAYRPTRTKFIHGDGTVEEKHWPQPGPGQGSGWYNGFGSDRNAEGEGHGMFWEADEAALALVEGRKEGRFQGWEESITVMEVMDEVRKQGGLKYPDDIESTEFPLDLKGR